MFCANIDLPTPFGPTNTTLAASLRKSSVLSASTAARSQCLGQVQSKSQSGLKRPICAALSRRSRLRLARCCSSQSSIGASQGWVATSDQWLSKPCRCSGSARARRASFSVFAWWDVGRGIVLFLELIVGFEGMWLHRGVACLQMRRQFDADRRWLAALLAPPRQGQAHGVRMWHPPLQRLEDGSLHFRGAGLRQQAHQGGGDGAEIGAAFGGADQQGLTGGRGLDQAIGGAVLTRGAFLLHQRLDVAVLLDLCVAVVASSMAGEHRAAVD